MAGEDVPETTSKDRTDVGTLLMQRSTPLHELLLKFGPAICELLQIPPCELTRIGSAVCRIVWVDNDRDIGLVLDRKGRGSGSIVVCNDKFYLLTCCHIFLMTKDAVRVKRLKDHYLEKKLRRRCKKATYFFSTKDFKRALPLPAAVVLKNIEDPVLKFDKLHDLLTVEVNDPASLPARLKPEKAAALIPIQPIPLQSSMKVVECLNGDVRLLVAHYPWQKDHIAKCLELSFGLKLKVNVWQDTLLAYTSETYDGSSGGPVLAATKGKLELVTVHRKSSHARREYKIGSIPNEEFLRRL